MSFELGKEVVEDVFFRHVACDEEKNSDFQSNHRPSDSTRDMTKHTYIYIYIYIYVFSKV